MEARDEPVEGRRKIQVIYSWIMCQPPHSPILQCAVPCVQSQNMLLRRTGNKRGEPYEGLLLLQWTAHSPQPYIV